MKTSLEVLGQFSPVFSFGDILKYNFAFTQLLQMNRRGKTHISSWKNACEMLTFTRIYVENHDKFDDPFFIFDGEFIAGSNEGRCWHSLMDDNVLEVRFLSLTYLSLKYFKIC